MKLNNQNKKQFVKDLLTSCKNGDIDFIKKVIDSGLENQITDPIQSKMLEHASGFGHIEIVQILYSSEYLIKKFNNEKTLEDSLYKAFLNGHVEIVDFLTPKIEKFGEDYKVKVVSSGICDAVMNGKLDMVKILIENPPIKTTLSKDFFIEKAINLGAIYDRVDILKYTIEKDNFQYFNNSKDNLLNVFWGALSNGSMNAIRYFIFDLNIEKTKEISELLDGKQFPDYEATNTMFQIRDEHKSLRNELPLSDMQNKSIKKSKL